MKSKLKDTQGLTLVEMLCVVLILVLLSLMMNTGLQLAWRSYQDGTAESETQLLLNTLSDALGDKLRFAVVTLNADGSYKGTSVGEVESDADGKLRVGGKKLLPDGAYGADRYKVTQVDVTPSINDTEVSFAIKLRVEDASSGIGAETTLNIRCLNPGKREV